MKLNAVGVSSTDLYKTVEFYKTLGFEFPEFKPEEDHIEAITSDGSARLMIDKKELITELLGEKPIPGNVSQFAIEYDSADALNEVFNKLKQGGFNYKKEPWDAFWGQRYAVVKDPDGYLIDLYARLNTL